MTIEYRNRVELKPGERIDDLERSGYGIIQNRGAFCFGMDAVLLSGFASVRKGGTAVDLGTGTGIIPILLEAKTEGRAFYGVEIQPEMADMAARSVRLNGLENKVFIIQGDLREIAGGAGRSGDDGDSAAASRPAAFHAGTDGGSSPAGGLLRELWGRVDTVTSNPPYMKSRHGLVNPDDSKAISRHEIKCTLSDVCAAAARLLKNGGRFCMVHRPARLPEIITGLKAAGLEPKRIRPVYPFADREANMVLIEAVKNGSPDCRFEKPVIVYREPGVYTDEIYDIYGY